MVDNDPFAILDPNDPDRFKGCCARCKYRLYSVLDSAGGTSCRFFWKTEECEYYIEAREFMKPFKEMQETIDISFTLW